ncbi:hypothetical protein RHSIM_Rhsim04G0092500 [Rhododendron simsii]|uniref:DUF2470 domain-containing protein n=1 Tax=Rhododendron simsii TaxID=118357 RepID=A0A834H3A2_RHOSS|nr:hypothetical protein RHSIM_Rhsim04G0092500 [Rhododendron simsii]
MKTLVMAPSSALHRSITATFARSINGLNNITITQKTTLSPQFRQSNKPLSLTPPPPLLAMASSSSTQSPPEVSLSLSLSLSLSARTYLHTVNAAGADVTAGDLNVFQLIQSHQEKAARLPPVEEVRTVLDHSLRGMLSTFSQKHEGYPSGSMVDFACDAYGSPILAVSSLAVHTKDLLANSKCSLLVAKDPEDRTDLIITLHGDAISVSETEREAIRTAYLARHPNAFWVDYGDFQFLHIEPKVVRYVSGVATASLGSGGLCMTQQSLSYFVFFLNVYRNHYNFMLFSSVLKIGLSSCEFLLTSTFCFLFLLSEFSKEEYRAAKVDPIYQFSKPIASHMNKDHAEDTKAIVQHSTSISVDFAQMLDVDSRGFYVKAGCQGDTFKLRVPFPRRAADRKDVKTLIVEMLQAAKA